MSADLRDLLERTAASPTTPVDPARIASRSRRRTRRRRGGAGLTGVALVVLLAVVAWPGLVPGDGLVIEDRAADQPEVPVLDLPDGWVQVQVGDAVFGIPAELEVVEVDADDPLPCSNDGNRAYLATDSYPAATHDEAGREHVCNLAGNSAPQLFAAPLSAVPAAYLGDEDRWSPRPIGELEGEWRLAEVDPPSDAATDPDDPANADDAGMADRTAWYRVPAVDLHLRFVTTEEDVTLVEAVLATITPIGGAADRASNEPTDESTEGGPGHATATELDLPEGWTQVTIGDAAFGIPTDRVSPGEFPLGILELAPTDGRPCHNGLDRIGTYLAPDGYPTGVVQDRDPGGVPLERFTDVPEVTGFCRTPLPGYTSLLAAPLSTVPAPVRQHDRVWPGEVAPVPEPVSLPGGLRGERTVVGEHLVTYALPQVDLWLEFHAPGRDRELADDILATVTATRPLEDVSEPDAPDAGQGLAWSLPGADVPWFDTPGSSLPAEGLVVRDPDELDALWRRAVRDHADDRDRPVPTLRDDEVALLATFTYQSERSCRGEVDLSAVEIDGQRVTIVFGPSLREPCITPAGGWTVAAILPADTPGLAGVTMIDAVERG